MIEAEYADDVARDLWKMLDREIEIIVSQASADGAEYPRSTIEDLRDQTNRFAIATARVLCGAPPASGVDLRVHLIAHAEEFVKAAAAMHAAKGPR